MGALACESLVGTLGICERIANKYGLPPFPEIIRRARRHVGSTEIKRLFV